MSMDSKAFEGVPFTQVDAFSTKPFGGNPAAVLELKEFLPDDVLRVCDRAPSPPDVMCGISVSGFVWCAFVCVSVAICDGVFACYYHAGTADLLVCWQKIAAENNLSETAFYVHKDGTSYHLRFLTSCCQSSRLGCQD